MSEDLRNLADRIREEMTELALVVERVKEGWQRAKASSDDFYLDAVALNLHGFYAGMERLFELIAETIDGGTPHGANWHKLLLEQMVREIPGVRPAVLSVEAVRLLENYRGFRHVVRNVYAYKFDFAKVEGLVEAIPGTFARTQEELLAFADFIEQARSGNSFE